MKIVFALFLVLVVVGGGLVACRPWLQLAHLERQVRKRFPAVEQVSTAALAEALARGEKIVLLDVRREDEFAVSHLPGAIRLDPNTTAPHLAEVDPATRIVAYCSVGWRSSQMVERLMAAGYHRAANLEGSIFAWAREGRPLVQGDKPVKRVHPYGRAWAFLVPRPLRAYTPEEARD